MTHSHHRPLLAVWTSDYDCKQETQFWYIVKDTPFDISQLKSKRRYEITRGNRYFLVKEFEPSQYPEDIYSIITESYKSYNRINVSVDKNKLFAGLANWRKSYTNVYGAFFRETGTLAGYTLTRRKGSCVGLIVHKTHPDFEKYQASAALINKLLEDHRELLSNGGYICDGHRNIQHLTNFHDYLAKYFMFRRAYCRLHIAYRPGIKPLVKMLYPFRKLLRKFDSFTTIHHVNGVLTLEEISRASKL